MDLHDYLWLVKNSINIIILFIDKDVTLMCKIINISIKANDGTT